MADRCINQQWQNDLNLFQFLNRSKPPKQPLPGCFLRTGNNIILRLFRFHCPGQEVELGDVFSLAFHISVQYKAAFGHSGRIFFFVPGPVDQGLVFVCFRGRKMRRFFVNFSPELPAVFLAAYIQAERILPPLQGGRKRISSDEEKQATERR